MPTIVRLFQIAAAVILMSLMAAGTAAAAEPLQASKAVWSADEPAPLAAVRSVCCKRGHRDWWAPSVRRCHAAGGYVAHPNYCFVDVRVCCKRGHRDWWAPSARACHHRGGVVVHRNHCRWD